MLRNRQDVEEKKLVGVNRVADPTKLKLGTFSELANWIQAKRYKIKKKRGPELLSGDEDITIPSPCTIEISCADSTARGQQSLFLETRFDQQSSFPPNGNLRTSWGYITAAEEVWALIGEASCAGGNMTYQSTCCQLNRWQTPLSVVHPDLIEPNPLNPAINTLTGTSDEPIYGYVF